MVKTFVAFLIVVVSVSVTGGQPNQNAMDETIYFQYKFFRQYFVLRGEWTPVGKYYENLIPVLKRYPIAYDELLAGIDVLKSSNRHAYVLGALAISNQIILEQMMERDMDRYIPIAGMGLYGAMIYTFIQSWIKLTKGTNKINKAVWIYNKGVYTDFMSERRKEF